MARSAQDIFNTANTQRTPEEWLNYYNANPYITGNEDQSGDVRHVQDIPELFPTAPLSALTSDQQSLDMNLFNQMNPAQTGMPEIQPLQQSVEPTPVEPTAEGSVGVNGPDGAVGEPGIPEVTDINALEGALAVINTVTNAKNEWDATSAMEGYRPNPDMTGYKPYDYSNTLMPIGVLKSQGQR